MSQRIAALNVEIERFKEFINKFHELFAQENFNYNLLESQFENLRTRNQRLYEENEQAQVKIKDALAAAEKIKSDALAYENQVKTSVNVFYHKAQAKYQEIEESLTEAEKKQIESHLKELETTTV